MSIQSIIECPQDISIFVLDKKYNFIYFNNAYKMEMFLNHGRYPAQGENILNFLDLKYVEKFQRVLMGEVFSEIDEGLKNDFWESSWSPYYEDDEIKGIVCFAKDITQIIIDKNDTEDKTSLLDAILECSPDVSVYAIDTEYSIIAFNQVFLREMRRMYDVEVDVGLNMFSFGRVLNDKDKYKEMFDSVLEGNHFHKIEEWDQGTWSDHLSPIYSKKTKKILGLTCFGIHIEHICN